MKALKIVGFVVGAWVVLKAISLITGPHEPMDMSSPVAPVAPAASSIVSAAPAYRAELISQECVSDYGRDRAEITIRNTGSLPIPYAKAFVEFQDSDGNTLSARDSYFSPSNIPVGATASATVYGHGGDAKSCGMTAMQDGDGYAVRVLSR